MDKACSRREFVPAFEGSQIPPADAPLTVPGCKILGLESRWGRKFTPAALQDAVNRGIYEGLVIYKDHPAVDYSDPNWSRKPLPPRSVDDVLGHFSNVRYVEGKGIFGDAVFTVDDTLTRSVVMAAKHNPKQYGFSHHAEYDSRFEGKTEVVNAIPVAHSVDLVTRPATTNGLFEGGSAVADETKKTKTVRQVLEQHCSLGIAKKVIASLEGDYMETPMGAMEEEVSTEDQIAAAFSAAINAVAAEQSDMKTKLAKLKQILTAQEKLAGGGEASTEGEAPPVEEEKEKTEAAPPIGLKGALDLLDKHQLPKTKTALESFALLPAEVAEQQAIMQAATIKENADLKAKLDLVSKQPVTSTNRIRFEGGAKPAEVNKDKPWLGFCRN